jgi:tetratricopeptide (TPR) repeat protein
MFVSDVAFVGVQQQSRIICRSVRGFSRYAFFVAICMVMVSCGQENEVPTPVGPVPLTFVGAESCSGCHEEQYGAWRGSHHDLAMQHATPTTVLGDFSGIEFENFGVTSTFLQRNGTYFVRTDNANGELEEFPLKFVFGVTPLQQYLIEFPGGRLQPLPIAWDTRGAEEGGQRWFHLYADEFIEHTDLLHWTGREQNWNYMCAECHSTNLQKNYSVDSDSFDTTWSEINVACEACHGPGSRHVQQANNGNFSGLAGLVTDLDDAGRAVWQMNNDTGIAERSELRMRAPVQPEACGRCHSRRSVASSEYEFGKTLLDTHTVALLDENLYFPDGQIREEVYVYGSFIQSRMYQAGVTCGDCHDPHSAELRSGNEASDICSTCHLPARFASTDHHRHQTDDVACVDCHMPTRIYMGNDARRDHSFRIPRPALTVATGSPNACNQCHSDKDAQWAKGQVSEWYGDSQEQHYGQAIHAGQAALAGANQLLLAAIENTSYPGIARATALTLLRAPYSSKIAKAIQDSLLSPDPFIRIGALRTLSAVDLQLRAQWAGPLLADPVRSVRIEAARVVSPARSVLHVQHEGAFRQAQDELIDALHAVAERPEAHSNLSNIYAESGRTAQAEAALRTAIRIDPHAVGPRVNLADLYRLLEREPAAEQVLREGLATNADAAALHHSLGLLLVRGNEQDKALLELEMSTTLDPGNARFAYVYAVALNSLGRIDRSIDVIQDAAIRFPADFDIRWALVSILRDQGRIDEAKAAAVGLSEQYPEVESVQVLLHSLNSQ